MVVEKGYDKKHEKKNAPRPAKASTRVKPHLIVSFSSASPQEMSLETVQKIIHLSVYLRLNFETDNKTFFPFGF